MEKILVGVESKMKSLWPVIYALNLAKRMEVRLYILLIENSVTNPHEEMSEGIETPSLKNKLEDLILKGRSEGSSIDYYITGGSYTDELIRFIQEKKISLLVVGHSASGKKKDVSKCPGTVERNQIKNKLQDRSSSSENR